MNNTNFENLFAKWIAEQRRSRRWGLFFKFAIFLYIGYFVFSLSAPMAFKSATPIKSKHVALVDIRGIISPDSVANADNIAGSLRAAFDDLNSVAVIIRLNSPGGSPVQSAYIYDEIMRLKMEYNNVPVYAVCTDVCASGAYEIAAAADEIYANRFSIVGSIGVIMNGFGFVDTIEKIGVERRLMTAGKNKGFLDPFSPVEPAQVNHAQSMLDSIHDGFIHDVVQARGERININDETFSGMVWTGEQALEIGLIDGLASAGTVARDIIGNENIVDYSMRQTYLERLADYLGTNISNRFIERFSFGGHVEM